MEIRKGDELGRQEETFKLWQQDIFRVCITNETRQYSFTCKGYRGYGFIKMLQVNSLLLVIFYLNRTY